MSSDIPELARIMGRLERSVEDGQKENGRRFDIISQKQADQHLAIGRVADKQLDLEQRMLRAESLASTASRSADQSKSEIVSVKDAMVRHIKELEKTVDNSRAKSDQRNDAQDAMLQQLLAGQQDAKFRAQAKSEIKLEQEASAAMAIVKAREDTEYAQAQFEKKLLMWIKAAVVGTPILGAIGTAIGWLLTH